MLLPMHAKERGQHLHQGNVRSHSCAQDVLDDLLHLTLDLCTWPGASWLASGQGCGAWC